MIDEDVFDTREAKELKIEYLYEEAVDSGNMEEARRLINKMAELPDEEKTGFSIAHARILEEDLLDTPYQDFIKK
jgi:hypothetical protein